LNFAIEGITSFTSAPLRIATYVGSLTALFAFLFGVWIIIKSIIFGEAVQGYPTLMITILFLGGMQMLFTGILGEYLGRIFGETKRRPLYLIERHVQSKNFNRK
jgi:glycosyltransferase involved in cell wall biosynthesis